MDGCDKKSVKCEMQKRMALASHSVLYDASAFFGGICMLCEQYVLRFLTSFLGCHTDLSPSPP